MVTFVLILEYIVALIAGGVICFCFLFPMIGQWIINFNHKLQNRIAKLKAEEDQRKEKAIKQFEDGVRQNNERQKGMSLNFKTMYGREKEE